MYEYRVAIIHESIGHVSYIYHGTRKAAERMALKEDLSCGFHGAPDRIEVQERFQTEPYHDYKTTLTFTRNGR